MDRHRCSHGFVLEGDKERARAASILRYGTDFRELLHVAKTISTYDKLFPPLAERLWDRAVPRLEAGSLPHPRRPFGDAMVTETSTRKESFHRSSSRS